MINYLKKLFGFSHTSEVSMGRQGENHAKAYLKKLGYKILAHSYKNKIGEIDLIARDGKTIVFCEVKTRSSEKSGHPLEAIHHQKQKKIVKVAHVYLKQHRLTDVAVRFDAIGIMLSPSGEIQECRYVKAAFDASVEL